MRVQFSANLLIGTLEPLLCGIMNEAVKMADQSSGSGRRAADVALLGNFPFMGGIVAEGAGFQPRYRPRRRICIECP